MKSYVVPYAVAAAAALVLTACEGTKTTATVEKGDAGTVKATVDIRPTKLDKLPRIEFNKRAAELNLPIFWRTDANNDNALEPDELAALWGVADTKKSEWADDKGD